MPKTKKKTIKKARKTVKKKTTAKKAAPKKTVAAKKQASRKKSASKKKAVARKKPAVKNVSKRKTVARKKIVAKKVSWKILGKRIPVAKLEPRPLKSAMTMNTADLDEEIAKTKELIEKLKKQQGQVKQPAAPQDAPAQADEQMSAAEIDEAELINQNPLPSGFKKAIMYVSIFVIMGVIISFWFVGIKNSLGLSFDKNQINNLNTGALGGELNDIIDNAQIEYQRVRENLDKQTQDAEKYLQETQDQLIEQQVKEDVTDQLKEKLQNLPQTTPTPALNINRN